MVRYDEALLAKLPAAALTGPVAEMCRGASPLAATKAALVEGWADRFNLPRKLRTDLTSPDVSSFRSGWWELVVTAALSSLGYEVDLRAKLPDGRTPDLVVEREGLRTIVEVFVVGDDAETVREQALLQAITLRLEERVEMPAGTFVSMTALRPVSEMPTEVSLQALAEALQHWLSGPTSNDFQHLGPLAVRASVMPGALKPQIALTPMGGVLNQRTRIRDRLRAKIERYSPSVADDLRLSVAVCEGGWKITRDQVIGALYGQECVQVHPVTGELMGAFYDGTGAAVTGGPNAADGADRFCGAWYFAAGLYCFEPPGVHVGMSFAHSPYCKNPLPNGSLAPLPEMRVQGGGLGWIGDPYEALVT